MSSRCRLWVVSAVLFIPASVIGSGNIHTAGSYISDAPSGTPPLVVNSSDLVPNLNADMLDGEHGANFALKTELPDDGVLEINQDCAVNTGCFTGDSPGFPISISLSAASIATSFRLTSNLDVSGEPTPEDVTAISVVNIPGILIDFNGFSIIGPNSCTGLDGSSLSCSHQSSATNNGAGIFGGQALTVRNGTIRGMGGHGFFCNANCKISGMHLAFNGRDGASLAGDSHINRSSFYRNAGNGLSVGRSSAIADASADGNAGHGFAVTDSCVVRDSTSRLNGMSGIVTGTASLVAGNTARANAGHGIDITNSMAVSNILSVNIGHGLNMDTDSVARSNAFWTDSINGGNQMGDNWCDTGLCP